MLVFLKKETEEWGAIQPFSFHLAFGPLILSYVSPLYKFTTYLHKSCHTSALWIHSRLFAHIKASYVYFFLASHLFLSCKENDCPLSEAKTEEAWCYVIMLHISSQRSEINPTLTTGPTVWFAHTKFNSVTFKNSIHPKPQTLHICLVIFTTKSTTSVEKIRAVKQDQCRESG